MCRWPARASRLAHASNSRTSIRRGFVRLAIEYEFERQAALLESGGTVVRETRSWNESRGRTESSP